MPAFLRSEAPLFAAAATAAIVYSFGDYWFDHLGNPLVAAILLVWMFAVMAWAVFSVVRHAEHLADRLGDPYGTLILTISVISIEVSVIAAIMLNADPDPELARDTMFAVLMIVLNFLLGLALLVGGVRHGEQSFNLQGARSFLSVLIPLAVISLILPRFMHASPDAGLTAVQGVLFGGATLALYGIFLAMQTGWHSNFFVAPGVRAASAAAEQTTADNEDAAHSVPYHAILLILTLLSVVLLSEKFAAVVDHSIDASGVPASFGGMLVAILVLAPEGFAAVHAAYSNNLQRAVNVCLGAALATIGLTVPAVLVIGAATDIHVILGLIDTKIVLLALTLFVASLTFGGVRTNLLQGIVHMALFVVYIVLIFD